MLLLVKIAAFHSLITVQITVCFVIIAVIHKLSRKLFRMQSEKTVRYSGFGTQRIEEELKMMLPDARILRMDADTTMAKFSHEKN